MGEVEVAEVFADVFGEEGGAFNLAELAGHGAGEGGDAGLGEGEDFVAGREGLDFGFEGGFDVSDIFFVAVEDVVFKEGAGR